MMDEIISMTKSSEIMNYKVKHSETNKTIEITKILSKYNSEHVAVYYGSYEGRPVVIKYYHRGRKDMLYEISIMKYAQKIGMPIYWFSSKFTLLGKPVLVMEKLVPITPLDDVKQLLIDVLTQMKYLHMFCCHCDIKMNNVMKRAPDSDKLYNNPFAKGLTYFMIDYGGCAKKPDKYGYCRHTYNPSFTSQPRGRTVIVTFVHDLLELFYLANYLLTKRDTNKEFDKRHDINPKLLEYYNFIISLKPDTKYDTKIHEALIDIVSRTVPS